jgi:peptidoglycan/xylan/chitin deacetylase (PgdA/CDA1 family)
MALWRYWHRHSISILMLHGIMDEDVPSAWVPLRPQMSRPYLDRCLGELAKRYTFISMDDAAAMLAGRAPMRPYCLAITCDDGYRNQVSHAAPIFRKHGAPYAVYLATGHIDERKPFWFDRLDYALQAREKTAAAPMSRPRLSDEYKRLRDRAKAVDRDDCEMVQELDAMAADFERQSGHALSAIFEHDDWSAVLTWDDARHADRALVTFGSHTVDHVRLAHVSAADALDQCRRSKHRIEAQLGRECRHFCYPNGSVDDKSAEAVRSSGYLSAVTTEEGLNTVGVDLMRLQRINFDVEGSSSELLARVSGLSQAMSKLVVWIRSWRLGPPLASPAPTAH